MKTSAEVDKLKQEKIGGALAFPGAGYNYGMTYREWLIGQALAGAVNSGCEVETDAANAIECADAVIRKLAEEQIKGEK